ncbi:lipase maturation factor 2-like isoform X2 [Gigantopelta aegis]|uniref:lipase maturation factor 2-like isoform X2 n=1 Tax=Gigantopelta aegis TaxID=1735272 RepID=UPI001B88AC55|nr:lipase maturation factor 2-like isoform X2 [Gigantopelta aegis]
MSNIKYTKDFFLWCMSVIYLFAFSSLYVQIPGLYGDNGLLPARNALKMEANSWQELLEGQPSLLKLTPKLGLDMQTAMDLLCLGGILISFFCMVSQRARDVVSFTLLWMLYLSLYQVGQTFLWFQWDILLLEVGFLTLLIAPFNFNLLQRTRVPTHHQHDTINMWLVKWLLFRLMFASGVVKLTSRCPTWWGLTALTHHFESQCIPTPLAWYWHQFPTWFLKMSCVLTYVLEIPIPFLFFIPIRSLKIFAFYSQVVLQVLIILTGNYNFFNLLTIVLCVSLLDDGFFKSKSATKKSLPWSGVKTVAEIITPLVVLGYIGYQTVKYFNLQLNPDFSIKSSIAFTEPEFTKFLQFVLPITILMGIATLGYEIVIAIIRSCMEEEGVLRKSVSVIQCLIFGSLAVSMFAISLVPHTMVEMNAHRAVWPSVRSWHDKLEPFQITNSYGLFRSMTGIGGRPEVVIEGSNHKDAGWKEYEFLYKPGSVKRKLPVLAPHQPRLDWQMWFAALGNYQNNPWFLNLVYRLLNNEKDVLDLIERNPFPDKPPKFIRAILYHYHFTSSDPKSNRYSTTNWWIRKKKAEYLPILSKDEETLKQYVQQSNLVMKSKKMPSSMLGSAIQWLRHQIGQPEGFKFVMSVFASGMAVNMLNHYLF